MLSVKTDTEELQTVDSSIVSHNGSQKYQFSDLVGKLEWDGDAVAQQRALRDEWNSRSVLFFTHSNSQSLSFLSC